MLLILKEMFNFATYMKVIVTILASFCNYSGVFVYCIDARSRL